MNWQTPTGSQTPCRLYVNGILVCTIRESQNPNFPFYFSQKIPIITYNGSFKSINSAKLHAQKRLREFSSCVLAFYNKNNSSNTNKNA